MRRAGLLAFGLIRSLGLALGLALIFTSVLRSSASAEEFIWSPPGDLEAGSNGLEEWRDFIPGMRFPIEFAPAYANSQVYGVGGLYGPPGSGGTCSAVNYQMPWRDNYCEPRTHSMPLCPSGTGHQGQDIRPATCERGVHPVVSADAGRVTHIGSYSVSITSDDGTRHRYLHMDMSNLLISLNEQLSRGQRIGFVSNDFGGTPTSIHLHYDVNQIIAGSAQPVYVSPYMALVNAYQRLLGEPCELIPAEGTILDDRSPCVRLHGAAQFWREVDDERAHGGSLRWTRTFDGASPSNWAEWELYFDEAGRYRLALFKLDDYGSSEQVPVHILHADGEATFTLDLLAHEEGFVPLGEYDFAEGSSGSIALFDNTGEVGALDRRIPIDALEIVRVSEDEGDDDGDDDDDGGSRDPRPIVDAGEEEGFIGEAWNSAMFESRGGGCSAGGAQSLMSILSSIFAIWALSFIGPRLMRPKRRGTIGRRGAGERRDDP